MKLEQIRGQNDPAGLDRRAVRRAFDRASPDYDAAAVLQAEVRKRLLERLEYIAVEPGVILDLGAGTGHASRALKQRFPKAQVIALDVAPGMLREARHQQGWLKRFSRVCADANRLPLRTASVDFVISNLMLQWCDPPDAVFAEVQRILKPGGLFSFTSFGPDTLTELRQAWGQVDDRPHVHRFIDMHDLGDALVRARLAEPVLDVERFTLTYTDAWSLMRELKTIGARNAASGRSAGLTGRRTLERVAGAYEPFRQDGRLPATYEIVYGQSWGSAAGVERAGEVRIPLERIVRRKSDND